jgi:peptidoglycan/LPS O-acetylase OafA/YrhL
MVALTAIPSFHFLLTSERSEFFRSVAAVVTFTSNFFFWFQAGYFDRAAVEKPLLHTWSLAAEEQFYLVMPLLLWALIRFVRGGRIAQPLFTGADAPRRVPPRRFQYCGSASWLIRRNANPDRDRADVHVEIV